MFCLVLEIFHVLKIVVVLVVVVKLFSKFILAGNEKQIRILLLDNYKSYLSNIRIGSLIQLTILLDCSD